MRWLAGLAVGSRAVAECFVFGTWPSNRRQQQSSTTQLDQHHGVASTAEAACLSGSGYQRRHRLCVRISILRLLRGEWLRDVRGLPRNGLSRGVGSRAKATRHDIRINPSLNQPTTDCRQGTSQQLKPRARLASSFWPASGRRIDRPSSV